MRYPGWLAEIDIVATQQPTLSILNNGGILRACGDMHIHVTPPQNSTLSPKLLISLNVVSTSSTIIIIIILIKFLFIPNGRHSCDFLAKKCSVQNTTRSLQLIATLLCTLIEKRYFLLFVRFYIGYSYCF